MPLPQATLEAVRCEDAENFHILKIRLVSEIGLLGHWSLALPPEWPPGNCNTL